MKITLLTGKTYKIKEAIDFDIKINPSPTAKRMTLRVDSKERIPVLTLPKYCSNKKAIEFVHANEDWLKKQLSYIPEQKKFQNGDKISLFGKKYVIKHDSALRAGVFTDNKQSPTLYVSGAPEFLHRRVIGFIRELAKKELTKMTRDMAAKIHHKVNNVVIKDTRSRWGSCSSHDNINYSWRISLAPIEVIRYLVAHEVSHLKHQDHSQEFWQCVKSLERRTTHGKNWLRDNGKELYSY